MKNICRTAACILFAWFLFTLAQPVAAAAESRFGIVALPRTETSSRAYHRSYQRLQNMLMLRGLRFGNPIFIRIFKEEKELEVWIRTAEGSYKRFKTYGICHHSGGLGPKLAEGDLQSPEGFYRVGVDQMNPWSDYHLSFNLGYPNEYDAAHKRTGQALMVHGRCSSIGCFAMTDYYMDEIYTLAAAALSSGQPEFDVHIFPFRLTAENLAGHGDSPWLPFWLNLKEGYDYFERYRHPPEVSVVNKRYTFGADRDPVVRADRLPERSRISHLP